MAKYTDVKMKAFIQIGGVVQGVGFRPFVLRIARKYSLCGFVKNESGQVLIEAEGSEENLLHFLDEFKKNPPVSSKIERLEKSFLPLEQGKDKFQEFFIAESGNEKKNLAMPAPDIAICGDCLCELKTQGNPRYCNPFISCVNCGPRFSVLNTLPYDRENISMSVFPLCSHCEAEYEDSSNRRCHAQTICCNDCGPVLTYQNRNDIFKAQDALDVAIEALKNGEIISIKGIGGYHFACDPFKDDAVIRLRELKGREAKPFAVMFSELDGVRKHCYIDRTEEELLLSDARPIVLLLRKDSEISGKVFGTSRFLGAFLPYTPLQYLLLKQTGPLVMTSANSTTLPILKDNEEILHFFAKHDQLSGVLMHNRDIVRRLDDSVTSVVNGKQQLIRRARGYVPLPITVTMPDGPAVLACGPQQKNTICLSAGPYCYMSTEIGDLDSRESVEVYLSTVHDMQGILGIIPEFLICDMHPLYETTKYASESNFPVIQVQHHYAHIASVMAEHGLCDEIIGVAFDGTGYGLDGTVWGGEFLISSPLGFKRAGHLRAVKLLGSDESIRQGWKTALCMLYDAGIMPDPKDVRGHLVREALDAGINTILSSSMGRVFDAVSAILGICDEAGYEGQCAIELENAAANYKPSSEMQKSDIFPYNLVKDSNGTVIADLSPCIRTIYQEKEAGQNREYLAMCFHKTVCSLIIEMCIKIKQESGLDKVALSGGVFQNRILVSETINALENAGFTVYLNQKVPPNDGGVSLGQAYIGRFMTNRSKGSC